MRDIPYETLKKRGERVISTPPRRHPGDDAAEFSYIATAGESMRVGHVRVPDDGSERIESSFVLRFDEAELFHDELGKYLVL